MQKDKHNISWCHTGCQWVNNMSFYTVVLLQEEPKKVCFNYDLFLNLEGNPPVNHLRCEKLTFNNPTKEFRRKLIKAGGVRLLVHWADGLMSD